MSRPYAWNGTTWKDARFLVGGQWLSYIPPEYDVDHGSWTFASGPESWTWTPGLDGTQTPDWSAGVIGGHTPTGGLFDYGTMSGPQVPAPANMDPTALSIGVQARVRVIMDTPPGSGPGLDMKVQPFGSGYSPHVVGIQHNVWTTVTTPQLGAPADFLFSTDRISLNFGIVNNAGWWEGHFRAEVDHAHMWDLTNGRPLKTLGDPGWQPKVLTVSDGWV